MSNSACVLYTEGVNNATKIFPSITSAGWKKKKQNNNSCSGVIVGDEFMRGRDKKWLSHLRNVLTANQ